MGFKNKRQQDRVMRELRLGSKDTVLSSWKGTKSPAEIARDYTRELEAKGITGFPGRVNKMHADIGSRKSLEDWREVYSAANEAGDEKIAVVAKDMIWKAHKELDPGKVSPRANVYDFIEQHRAEIDAVIKRKAPNWTKPIDDAERRLWVLNDEGLYNWAKSEGCSPRVESASREGHLYRIYWSDGNDRQEIAHLLAKGMDSAAEFAKKKFLTAHGRKKIISEDGDDEVSYVSIDSTDSASLSSEDKKDFDNGMFEGGMDTLSLELDDDETPDFKTIYGTNEFFDLMGKKPKKAKDVIKGASKLAKKNPQMAFNRCMFHDAESLGVKKRAMESIVGVTKKEE
jgi:hypothetical protein